MDEEKIEAGDRVRARLALALGAYTAGVSLSSLSGRRPLDRTVVHVRQVAMYLCHVGFGMSLTRIARVFRKDRSTISFALHAMEDRRDEPEFDSMCDALEEVARVLPPPPASIAPPRVKRLRELAP